MVAPSGAAVPRANQNKPQTWDEVISERAFKVVGTRVPRPLLKALEHSGNGLLWFPIAISGALGYEHPQSICWFANLLLGLCLDLVMVGILKGIVRRPRPSYNQSSDYMIVVSVDSYSFPSGHTSRACLLAAFTAACVPKSIGVVAAAAVWGTCVAISRVLLGRHYATDVLAGMLLGIVCIAAITAGCWCSEGFLITEGMAAGARQRVVSFILPADRLL